MVAEWKGNMGNSCEKIQSKKLQILWTGCKDQDVSRVLLCVHLSSPPHLHQPGPDGAPAGADGVCNLLAPPPPCLLPLPHLAQPGHLGSGALLLSHHLVQQPGSPPSTSPLCLRPPLPPRLPRGPGQNLPWHSWQVTSWFSFCVILIHYHTGTHI